MRREEERQEASREMWRGKMEREYFHNNKQKSNTGEPVISTRKTYTKDEILHLINKRISAYEKLVKQYPSQSRQFGDKIDELITKTTIFS
jgi:hypothetical protein